MTTADTITPTLTDLTRDEINYREHVLAAERARAMRAAELESVRAALAALRSR